LSSDYSGRATGRDSPSVLQIKTKTIAKLPELLSSDNGGLDTSYKCGTILSGKRLRIGGLTRFMGDEVSCIFFNSFSKTH
jgi:hypothetical protein